MKKMTCFVMALALVLGLAQCKKEQIEPQNEGNSVMITLDVDGGNNNGSRAEVDPPHVNFVDGDQILVAYDGKYVGTLTKSTEEGSSKFRGSVTITQNGDQPLYFYFLGNKQDNESLTKGSTTSCTVNISNQTTTAGLPVISMGRSLKADGGVLDYVDGMTSFTSRLYNKCSLMKFNVTTPSTADICITGMNNEVTVNFNPETEDERFEYGMNETDGGLIEMPAKDAQGVTWAIVLPRSTVLPEGEDGSAYSEDGSYIGKRPEIHVIESNKYYQNGISLSLNTHVWNGNLAILTEDDPEGFATATDGMTIYGTLDANVKVSIAAGATVTLLNADINGNLYWQWEENAGLTCLGDATIIVEGTNTVCSMGEDECAIQAGPAGTTLTISGTGQLTANCKDGYEDGCYGAAIGGGYHKSEVGNIVINSGTIIAKGGYYAAAIGTGENTTCGNITIAEGVNVTAVKKGSWSSYCIGAGNGGSCGTITIGGTVYSTGVTPNQTDGITFIYPVPVPEGAINGRFTIDASGKQVYFSQGNLQTTTSNNGSTWTWSFAANQWSYIGNAVANNAINGNGTVSSNGTIDLFGWSATTNFYGINNNTSSYSGNFVDWGANAISNGGNQANIWRTLTKDEWGYLFNNRTTAAGTAPSIGGTDNACFAKAYLFGTTHGVILFPDNYVHPTGVATPTGINQTNNTSWNTNNYSAEDWSKMEQAGAVFLPAAGGRLPSAGIVNVGAIGLYWSATFYGNDRGYCLLFNNGSLNAVYYDYNLWNGASVRLVRDAE